MMAFLSVVATLATLQRPLLAFANQPQVADRRSPVLPHLLTYPSTYRDSSGHLVAGFIPTTTEQMTTLVPNNKHIDGVVVIVYWSVLEPRPGVFRWNILDALLRYWANHGKRVVLNPVVYGAPVQFPAAWGGLQDGLPSWLVPSIKTLPAYRAPVFGFTHKTAPVAVPVPWNPDFLASYRQFIQQLGARYNGNPTLAYVRIGTGRMGEETYPYSCGPRTFPPSACSAARRLGWTPANWYRSVIAIAQIYRTAFPSTLLSIDIVLVGEFLQTRRPPDPDRTQAEQLMVYASRHRIMLGYNGLSSDSLGQATAVQTADWKQLESFVSMGHPVELETFAPPYNAAMDDPGSFLRAISTLRPTYVNFFGEYWSVDAYLQGNRRSASAAGSWSLVSSALRASGVSQKAVHERAEAWHRVLQSLEIHH